MIRHTVIWLALAIVAGTGLFLVKHEVQDQEDKLATLDDKIAKDRETIHVLHAEWAYLTQPDRLARLASRYLALRPPTASQIADSIEKLPPLKDALPAADGTRKPTLATMKVAE